MLSYAYPTPFLDFVQGWATNYWYFWLAPESTDIRKQGNTEDVCGMREGVWSLIIIVRLYSYIAANVWRCWKACRYMEGVEPTYDYIENTYSCVIIDKDLFGLLSDEELDFIEPTKVQQYASFLLLMQNNVAKSGSFLIISFKKLHNSNFWCTFAPG